MMVSVPLLCLLVHVHSVIAGFSYIGCYANTGVSLAFRNTYPSSPVEQCSNLCWGSKYVGIIDGNKCFCGESSPLSNSVSDANCNNNCTGSGINCGGSSYYAVYVNQDIQSSSSGSSSFSLSLSLTFSSSFSSSTAEPSSSTLSGTITVSPSSSFSYVVSTAYNSSSVASTSSYSPLAANLSSSRTLSHSHRSATTSSSSQTVITSNSEYVRNGITITSQVLLTTNAADVELTRTADNVVSSSVTVVNSKSASIKNQVAGGVVGATAGISLICFLVWYYTRRVKQKDEEEKQRNLATIAATMISRNPDLSSSGTIHGINPFSDRNNTLGSKSSSTKRRLDAMADDQDSFKFYNNPQHLIRMGSTGHESVMPPVRMGSTGHDDDAPADSFDSTSYGDSTLGSFSSSSSDGYYAQKMAQATALTRNSSSATNHSSNSRYSFASFESRKIIVDDEIASNVERDDGSVHELYAGPATFGLTIANPDNDSDSDDDNHVQCINDNNGNNKLRVLF